MQSPDVMLCGGGSGGSLVNKLGGDLTLIPRLYTVEEENRLLQVVL